MIKQRLGGVVMKGINKRVNNITKKYMYKAEPSKGLKKHTIAVYPDNRMRYQKRVFMVMDEIDIEEVIKEAVQKASTEEKRVVYIK